MDAAVSCRNRYTHRQSYVYTCTLADNSTKHIEQSIHLLISFVFRWFYERYPFTLALALHIYISACCSFSQIFTVRKHVIWFSTNANRPDANGEISIREKRRQTERWMAKNELKTMQSRKCLVHSRYVPSLCECVVQLFALRQKPESFVWIVRTNSVMTETKTDTDRAKEHCTETVSIEYKKWSEWETYVCVLRKFIQKLEIKWFTFSHSFVARTPTLAFAL